MYSKIHHFILLALLLSGCRTDAIGDDEMYRLGSALTKLSASIESAVRYKNPPADLSDTDLLTFATRHDPELLQPFTDLKLRVKREDRHAIVLVCAPDGKRALLEDAGCSKELDAHHWQSQPSRACEFTVSTLTACGAL